MAGTVLVVDSDAAELSATQSFLESRGIDVVTAGSAAHARLAIAEFAPAVIVVDADIDGGSGFEFCRSLVEEGGATPPPVLLTSRRLRGKEAHLRAKHAGARLFLERPEQDRVLLAAVMRLLEPPAPMQPLEIPPHDRRAGAPRGPGATAAVLDRPAVDLCELDEDQVGSWIEAAFDPSKATEMVAAGTARETRAAAPAAGVVAPAPASTPASTLPKRPEEGPPARGAAAADRAARAAGGESGAGAPTPEPVRSKSRPAPREARGQEAAGRPDRRPTVSSAPARVPRKDGPAARETKASGARWRLWVGLGGAGAVAMAVALVALRGPVRPAVPAGGSDVAGAAGGAPAAGRSGPAPVTPEPGRAGAARMPLRAVPVLSDTDAPSGEAGGGAGSAEAPALPAPEARGRNPRPSRRTPAEGRPSDAGVPADSPPGARAPVETGRSAPPAPAAAPAGRAPEAKPEPEEPPAPEPRPESEPAPPADAAPARGAPDAA
ncbi:MAG: response regulator, partial [Acidobacteria bacterium]